MKKKRKLLLGIILGLGLGGVILFGMLILHKKPIQNTPNSILSKSAKSFPSGTVLKKNIENLSDLIEIPNAKVAIVMEVTDQKIIREFDPLFGRTYNGDLIVFLPEQTIIYDSTTKTVRDIISKSFYEEVKK